MLITPGEVNSKKFARGQTHLVVYGGPGEFHELAFSGMKPTTKPELVEGASGSVSLESDATGAVTIGFTAGPERRIVQVTSDLFVHLLGKLSVPSYQPPTDFQLPRRPQHSIQLLAPQRGRRVRPLQSAARGGGVSDPERKNIRHGGLRQRGHERHYDSGGVWGAGECQVSVLEREAARDQRGGEDWGVARYRAVSGAEDRAA